jgi:hypothetical protein
MQHSQPKNPQKYVSKIGLGNHELSHFFQKVAIFLADTVEPGTATAQYNQLYIEPGTAIAQTNQLYNIHRARCGYCTAKNNQLYIGDGCCK